MYKIKDSQFSDRYFGGDQGVIFKDLKEVCEQLISYHDNDCCMEIEQELLDKGKIKECWNELSFFEWELEKI